MEFVIIYTYIYPRKSSQGSALHKVMQHT